MDVTVFANILQSRVIKCSLFGNINYSIIITVYIINFKQLLILKA